METFVGIDVSKETLDVYSLAASSAWRLPNKAGQAEKLARQLHGTQLVVLEATGGYERLVVSMLQESGVPVAVVNPKRIRDFARSTGKLAKTDKLDARLLAEYAKTCQPSPQPKPDPATQTLQALNARRQDMIKLLTAEKNRSQQPCQESIVLASTQRMVQCLEEELATLDAEIQQLLKTHFSAKAKLLRSVGGVGEVLTATLLGDLAELGRLDGKQIAALVGLAPFNCDSGNLRGKRRVWGGRQSVRRILYMGANAARRYNPEIQAFYQKLRDAGKPFKVAMVACMRKLLVILNAKMRDFLAAQQTTPCLT